jgi:hypothetical protein
MAFRNTNSAETWDKIYDAFDKVNFVAYDFNTIKASLVDYIKIYYPEYFNDLIDSNELFIMIDAFAFIAEQLAYRVDMVGHENFITTAQRKQSILKLAKLISYKPTRNIPLRGLVKFTSITSTERVIDSRGIDLSETTIKWNDANNTNWKEQFMLLLNRVMTSNFGQPQKTFEINDVQMEIYGLNTDGFKNGVIGYQANAGLDTYPMELVPADLDENGPYEREPDLTTPFSFVYSNDGNGDASDLTGFLAYTKQGALTRVDISIDAQLPNRELKFAPQNVNHTDVWVQQLDANSNVSVRWQQIDNISEQNLIFNDSSSRKKFEVNTLENDQISVLFGDGDFVDAPIGNFRVWMRQSANRNISIQRSKVIDSPFTFKYVSAAGNSESCTITFSLTNTLQNGAASETTEHIRQAAPATYYSQNRMVNGQDYNTYMLKDQSILRIQSINRTFAGQPKYIDWNDASGSYENVKIFGDDARMEYQLGIESLTVSSSGQALVDSVIEPILKKTGVVSLISHVVASTPALKGVITPVRRSFIEDNRAMYKNVNNTSVQLISGVSADGSLKEKTAIQAVIDRHYYGEPLSFVEGTDGSVWAKIPNPDTSPMDDGKIYAMSVPRTVDGVNKYPPGDVGSGLQPIAEQEYFGLRYNPMMKGIGNGTLVINTSNPSWKIVGEVWTIEVLADKVSFSVRSSIRGTFATGLIGQTYQINPANASLSTDFFTLTNGSVAFEPGDSFVIDTASGGFSYRTNTYPNAGGIFLPNGCINLNGYWEIISYNELTHYAGGIVNPGDENLFTPSNSSLIQKQHSWTIFVKKVRNTQTNVVTGYEIHHRTLDLIVQSNNTKFWFNESDKILDYSTKKTVFDNIKILRSNKDSAGLLFVNSQIYDVVAAIKDSNGNVQVNKLSILPSDMLQESSSGDLIPDRALQFELVSEGNYKYFYLSDPTTIISNPGGTWEDGSFVDTTFTYGRSQFLDNAGEGLDFMWSHYASQHNIIDGSPTNIIDAYVLTRGYYDNVTNYVRGLTAVKPIPPTSLELRNAYGYMIKNKMLSDTLVMHSGKIKLLFGSLAEPQLRASIKVVKSMSASISNERIKEEILKVVNTYFDILNWDFGESFYATELISLIHQRLPGDVAGVVLVPTYSSNSFGDMLTVTSGLDEILQSCLQMSDIEIVDAFSPTVIRQVKTV